jgi:hypothetical protein
MVQVLPDACEQTAGKGIDGLFASGCLEGKSAHRFPQTLETPQSKQHEEGDTQSTIDRNALHPREPLSIRAKEGENQFRY